MDGCSRTKREAPHSAHRL